MLVASPDEVVRYRPMICAHCQQSWEGVAGQIKERAPLSITCRRYACSCESTRCRKCVAQRESLVSRGSDPLGGEAPVQYGPKIRALAVYLHEYQLVPLAQVSELLCDLCVCVVSEGTVLTWVEFAAETGTFT